MNAGAWFWGVVSVLGGLFLAGLLYFFLSNEVLLDVRGATTQAVVERVVEGSKTDAVHIRFTPQAGAAPVRATVESLFGRVPRVGERIGIDFDRGHPTRARLQGDHSELLIVPLIGAFFYAWLGLPFRRARSRRRQTRATGRVKGGRARY